MQVDKSKEKGLFPSEVQASKRQKLDGGLLRKVECLVVLSLKVSVEAVKYFFYSALTSNKFFFFSLF